MIDVSIPTDQQGEDSVNDSKFKSFSPIETKPFGNKELENAQKELKAINYEIKARKQILDSIKKNDAFKNNLVDDQISSLSEEIVLKNKQISEMQDRIIELEAKIKGKAIINSKKPSSDKNKEMEVKLSKAYNLISSNDKKFQKFLSDSNKQNTILKEKISAFQSEVERLNEKVNEYQKQIENKDSFLANAFENNERLSNENDELHSKLDETQKELNEERLAKEEAEQALFKQEMRLNELEDINTAYINLSAQVESMANQSTLLDQRLVLYKDYKKKYLILSKSLMKFCNDSKESLNVKVNLMTNKYNKIRQDLGEMLIEYKDKIDEIDEIDELNNESDNNSEDSGYKKKKLKNNKNKNKKQKLREKSSDFEDKSSDSNESSERNSEEEDIKKKKKKPIKSKRSQDVEDSNSTDSNKNENQDKKDLNKKRNKKRKEKSDKDSNSENGDKIKEKKGAKLSNEKGKDKGSDRESKESDKKVKSKINRKNQKQKKTRKSRKNSNLDSLNEDEKNNNSSKQSDVDNLKEKSDRIVKSNDPDNSKKGNEAKDTDKTKEQKTNLEYDNIKIKPNEEEIFNIEKSGQKSTINDKISNEESKSKKPQNLDLKNSINENKYDNDKHTNKSIESEKSEKSLVSKYNKLNLSNNEYIKKKLTKEKIKEKMAKTITKLQDEYKFLCQDFSDLIERLKKFETESKIAQEGYEMEIKLEELNISSELEDRDIKISQLTSKLNDIQVKKLEKDRESKGFESMNHLLQNRVNDLSQKVILLRNELSKEINDQNTTIKIKDRSILEMRLKIQELERINKDLKITLTKMSQQNFHTDTKEKESIRNYQSLLEKLSNYENLLKEYRKTIEKFNLERQSLERTVDIKNGTITSLSLKYTVVEEEIFKKDNQITNLELRLKKVENRANSGKIEANDKAGSLALIEFKKKLDMKDTEIMSLKEILRSLKYQSPTDSKNLKRNQIDLIDSRFNLASESNSVISNNAKSIERFKPIEQVELASLKVSNRSRHNPIDGKINYMEKLISDPLYTPYTMKTISSKKDKKRTSVNLTPSVPALSKLENKGNLKGKAFDNKNMRLQEIEDREISIKEKTDQDNSEQEELKNKNSMEEKLKLPDQDSTHKELSGEPKKIKKEKSPNSEKLSEMNNELDNINPIKEKVKNISDISTKKENTRHNENSFEEKAKIIRNKEDEVSDKKKVIDDSLLKLDLDDNNTQNDSLKKSKKTLDKNNLSDKEKDEKNSDSKKKEEKR